MSAICERENTITHQSPENIGFKLTIWHRCALHLASNFVEQHLSDRVLKIVCLVHVRSRTIFPLQSTWLPRTVIPIYCVIAEFSFHFKVSRVGLLFLLCGSIGSPQIPPRWRLHRRVLQRGHGGENDAWLLLYGLRLELRLLRHPAAHRRHEPRKGGPVSPSLQC